MSRFYGNRLGFVCPFLLNENNLSEGAFAIDYSVLSKDEQRISAGWYTLTEINAELTKDKSHGC